MYGAVGVKGIALGLETGGAELFDHRGGNRVLARIEAEGHQRPLARLAGDLPVFLGDQRVTRNQARLQALLAHLANDQAGLGMVATVIEDVDLVGLELADQRRVILLAGGDGVVEDLLDTPRVELLLGLVRQALGVGLLVVDDGDPLLGVIIGKEVARHPALLIVPAAGAEDVVAALIGQFRVGRRRRDLQHALFLIDLGGRDRGT